MKKAADLAAGGFCMIGYFDSMGDARWQRWLAAGKQLQQLVVYIRRR